MIDYEIYNLLSRRMLTIVNISLLIAGICIDTQTHAYMHTLTHKYLHIISCVGI